ncbi:MAG: PPC domain-containing protein [Anaerolineales bacterium]|nr:PPC domain-containing protein [Anaerolineales bacterium]
MPKYRLMILTLGVFALFYSLPHSHAQQRQLSFYYSVNGSLGDAPQLAQEWEFEGKAGQVISLAMETISGNLDPVVELYDTEGRLIAANDNASSTDTNARLEAITLSANGTYQVRAYREGLETGSTSGSYRLTLLEGFSTYNASVDNTLVISPDAPIDLMSLPTAYFHLQAAVNLPSTPYNLQWRFHDTEYTWAFGLSSTGAWSLELSTPTTILRTVSGQLDTESLPVGQRAILSFGYYEHVFVVHLNDTTITTTRISQSLTPLTPGTVQLAFESATDLLTISNLWLTTPYYAGTPAEAGALGPTPSGQRIYQYTGTPQEIINELRTLGYIEGSGGIQGEVADAYVFSDRSGFTTFNLIDRSFQNVVIGYQASLEQGVSSSACGVMFRQTTGATFGAVLATPTQGVYFLQFDDGYPEGLIQVSPQLESGIGRVNHFLVVAKDDRGYLFINGRLLGDISLKVNNGRTWSQVVVQLDGEAAYCRLQNFWLYALN